MRPIGWQRLFVDAPPVPVTPLPAKVDGPVVVSIDSQGTFLDRDSDAAEAVIQVKFLSEWLETYDLRTAAKSLLGLPNVVPAERQDTDDPTIAVPVHAPDEILPRGVAWQLAERLELIVCPEGAQLQLLETENDDERDSHDWHLVALDHEQIWWLARAMTSAQVWIEATSTPCGSCGADLNQGVDHLSTCGDEPLPERHA